MNTSRQSLSNDGFGEKWTASSSAWAGPLRDQGGHVRRFLAYDTPRAAMLFLEAHGGLVGTVAEWMAENGFERTDAPEDGDIGVAPLPDDGPLNIAHAAVVIRRGPWWLAKLLRGFASVTAQRIPAWRIF